MGIDIQTIVVGAALCIRIERCDALFFQLSRSHTARSNIKSRIRLFTRTCDAGRTIDRTAEAKLRLEGIGKCQRQIGKGYRKIETFSDRAIDLDLSVTCIDDDIAKRNVAALHGNRCRRGKRC
ncbi:hypothetical protein D3C81_1649350 [compost metagenome]